MRVARLIVATIPSLLRSVDSVEVPIASYDGFGNAGTDLKGLYYTGQTSGQPNYILEMINAIHHT